MSFAVCYNVSLITFVNTLGANHIADFKLIIWRRIIYKRVHLHANEALCASMLLVSAVQSESDMGGISPPNNRIPYDTALLHYNIFKKNFP
jgi:hypothetical protein